MTSHPLPPSVVPPPPPQERSGCLLALYIGLGVLALVIVLGVAGVWLFLRSERGQQLASAARQGIALFQEATTAPGATELREAGCTQALIVPTARLRELAGVFNANVPEDLGMSDAGTLVLCQQPAAGEAGCADIARIYGDAAPGAPDRLAIVVQGTGGDRTACQGIYAPDGTFIAPLEGGDGPP